MQDVLLHMKFNGQSHLLILYLILFANAICIYESPRLISNYLGAQLYVKCLGCIFFFSKVVFVL